MWEEFCPGTAQRNAPQSPTSHARGTCLFLLLVDQLGRFKRVGGVPSMIEERYPRIKLEICVEWDPWVTWHIAQGRGWD